MVFSHYSTTYMSIGIFATTYATMHVLRNPVFNKLTGFILNRAKSIKIVNLTNKTHYLSYPMVACLFSFALLWIAVTNSGNNLSDVTSKVLFSLNGPHTHQSKSSDTLYNIFNFKKRDDKELLKNYVEDENKVVADSPYKDELYDSKITDKYGVSVSNEKVLPLTTLGKQLSKFHINTFFVIDTARQMYAKLIQVFVMVGILGFLFYKKKHSRIDLNYISLSIAGTVILLVQVLLPAISAEYGILRAFQQSLMFLALPVTLGCIAFIKLFTKKYATHLTALVFVLYFLLLVGVIQQITGGYYGAIRLNNFGMYYDMYYTHKPEIASMDWLSENRDKSEPIQASIYTGSKLLANTGLFSSSDLLPQTIKKDSYLYIDYSKTKGQKDILFYKGDLLIYNYPMNFLNDNKNLVYNNGGSKIYK